MNPFPSDLFAKRLRLERERTGVDSRELSRRIAERLGGPGDPGLVSRIEDQTHSVRLDEAVVVADELGISLVVMIAELPDEEIDQRIAHLSAERTVAEAMWVKAEAASDQARQEVWSIDRDLRALAADQSQRITRAKNPTTE